MVGGVGDEGVVVAVGDVVGWVKVAVGKVLAAGKKVLIVWSVLPWVKVVLIQRKCGPSLLQVQHPFQ